MQVDEVSFERELQSQKKRSREALKSIDLTAGRLLGELAGQLGTSDFIGYEHGSLRAEASVLAILKEGKTVDSASAGTSFLSACGTGVPCVHNNPFANATVDLFDTLVLFGPSSERTNSNASPKQAAL